MLDTVGVIGLGIMGGAMARNLLAAGFRVVGYDVSERAIAAFATEGGETVANPLEVGNRARIVILSLPGVAALDEVVGGQAGLVRCGRSDLIVIEASTLSLDSKLRAREALQASGAVLLDCPVSGTGIQARAKDLVVFGSGDEAAFRRCQPVFDGMSRRQVYLGAFGNGIKMKLIANHLVTIHNVAAGEAIALGLKAGLALQSVYDVLADSAGSSRMFQVRGPQMVAGRYDKPTATIKTHLKDVGIINDFAIQLDMPVPLFAAAAQYYYACSAQGRDNEDTASVCAISEAFAGILRNEPPS